MLRLTIMVSGEQWDEIKEEFIPPKFQTIQLEHSLVSLSKWEAKWHKPFLSKTDKTPEETEDYVRCMTLTQNVDPEIYKHLSAENIRSVNEYIKDPMTATWFSEDKTKSKGKKNLGEQITAELIYYWMITLNIPLECQKWHLLERPAKNGASFSSELNAKIFFGITMPCDNYMPTYSPYNILLIANDRNPQGNENSLIRIGNCIYIAKRKVENGIAKYYSIRDGKFRLNESEVDEVVGYIATTLDIQGKTCKK